MWILRLATTEAALAIKGKHTLSWKVIPRAQIPTSSARLDDADLSVADRRSCFYETRSGVDGMARSTAPQRRDATTAPTPVVLAPPAGEPVTSQPCSNDAGSSRCSPETGSLIWRRCRSMPNCATSGSTCVRCPRCTGHWVSTRWSPNGAPPSQGVSGSGHNRTAAGVQLGDHQACRRGEGHLLRCVRDERHLLPLHRWCRGPRSRIRCAGKGTDGASVWGHGYRRSCTPIGEPR